MRNLIDIAEVLDQISLTVEKKLPEILKLRATRTEKNDGSYVTEGDLTVQAAILAVLREHLPLACIVSEELKLTAPEETPSGTVVVIDPIDGTENFTSGLPEWGVSVAIYHDGLHVGSLLGCPELHQWLRTGQNVQKYTSRIRGLSSSLTKEQIIAAASGYEYRILGCCVYNMLNVIRGSFYSFENPKGANSWDILAGLNLALKQGLNVTVENQSYAGEYLPPTRKYRFKVEQR